MPELRASPNSAASQRQLAEMLAAASFKGSGLPAPQTATAAVAQGLNPIVQALMAKAAMAKAGATEAALPTVAQAIGGAQAVKTGAVPFIHPDTGQVAPGQDKFTNQRARETLASMLGNVPGQEGNALNLAASELEPPSIVDQFEDITNDAGEIIGKRNVSTREVYKVDLTAPDKDEPKALSSIGKLMSDVRNEIITPDQAQSRITKINAESGDGNIAINGRLVNRSTGDVIADFSDSSDGDLKASIYQTALRASYGDHAQAQEITEQAMEFLSPADGGGVELPSAAPPSAETAPPPPAAPPAAPQSGLSGESRDMLGAILGDLRERFTPEPSAGAAVAAPPPPPAAPIAGRFPTQEAVRDAFRRKEINREDARRALQELGFAE